jgi:hypothetical protein
MVKLDAYNLRARLFPAVLGVAPAIALASVAVSWDDLGLPQAIATLAVGVLFVASADLARRLGRRKERKIFAYNNGRPTNSLLHHSDSTLDAKTKERYRDFIAEQLGESAPTQEDENRSPDEARAFYERCNAWLRENTRKTDDYKILFEENITYGFRRNLYGLKWPALVLNILVVVACIALHRWGADWLGFSVSRTQVTAVMVIAVLHAIYFLFFVSRKAVMEASDQYSRQLIISCEGLMAR